MKKKISIMFFLLAAIKSLLGAPPYSELNSMIYESLMDYITIFDIANNKGYRYEPSLRKSQHRKCRLMSKDFFICSDGMPQDFPYDRIQVEKLSLEFMEGNPSHIKKELHNYKTVLTVKYYINQDCVDIIINNKIIKRFKKHHVIIVSSGEELKHYYYKYNPDKHKWERITDDWFEKQPHS